MMRDHKRFDVAEGSKKQRDGKDCLSHGAHGHRRQEEEEWNEYGDVLSGKP